MSIVLLVGASGSGKSTIGKSLEEYGVKQLVSFTTRPMREGEVNGVDYYFINKLQIRTLHLVESVTYNGNTYGLTKHEVESKLSQNEHVYFITDKHGAEQIMNMYPDETVYFWLLTNPSTMRSRMEARGDSEKSIQSRILHADKTGELDIPNVNGVQILDAEKSVEELVKEISNKINH